MTFSSPAASFIRQVGAAKIAFVAPDEWEKGEVRVKASQPGWVQCIVGVHWGGTRSFHLAQPDPNSSHMLRPWPNMGL